jgi:hypothetical protein
MSRRGVDEFRPELSGDQVERLWQGMEGAARRRQMRRVVAVGVVSSALVAGLVSLVVPRAAGPRPLRAEGVSLEPGVSLPLAEGPVHFDEGSRISDLGSARVEVVAHRPDRFVTMLVRGAIAVEVTPGGPRAWAVETDLASIEVVGTAFDVVRDEAGLEVRVHHGLVVVSGERVDGRIQRLAAGAVLRVPAAAAGSGGFAGDRGAPAAVTATAAAELQPDVSRPSNPSDRVDAPPAPTRSRGAVAGAMGSSGSAREGMGPRPGAEGEAPAAPAPPSAPAPAAPAAPAPDRVAPALEEVLDTVASLRAGGADASAEALLRAAIDRSDHDAEAATLAFELGRWLAEQPGRRADAVAALRRVDRPGAPRELVEAARALAARLATD